MLNKETVRLLYIEDDEANAKLTIEYLKYDFNTIFEIDRTCTLAEGLEHLDIACKSEDDCNIDIILLDLVLPNSHGVATYKKVVEKCKFIPVVIVSGHEDLALQCMKLGAQDYLVKPSFSASSLKRVLRYSYERSKLTREKLLLERKYKRILDNTPVGFHNYELRDDGLYFIGYNPAAVNILHLDHSKLIGKKINDAFPGLINTDVEENYTKVITSGERFSEIREYTDTNIPRSFFKVNAFKTSSNDITVSFEDITYQVLAERKYKRLVEATNAGIYEIDFRTGKFVYVNHVMVEQSGYSREELLNMNASEILTEESVKKWLKRMESLKNGEHIDKTTDYTFIRKDGRLVYILITSEYIEDSEGNIIGANVVTIDITESVLAKEEARKKGELIFNELENRMRKWKNELKINVDSIKIQRNKVTTQIQTLTSQSEAE